MQLARCLRVNYELLEEKKTSKYEDLVFATKKKVYGNKTYPSRLDGTVEGKGNKQRRT